MGTFGSYRGDFKIPNDKKEQFVADAMKLIHFGGMMQFANASLFGKKVTLLKKAEADELGEVDLRYNYFEDMNWEDAGLYTRYPRLYSGKIGGFEYCDVITAINCLFDLYNEDFGYPEINGEIIYELNYYGWINHVLGRDYNMSHRLNIWDFFEKYYISKIRNYDRDEPFRSLKHALEFIPREYYKGIDGRDLADIAYVIEGTKSLDNEKLKEGTYPYDVWTLREAIREYHKNNKGRSAAKRLYDLLKLDRTAREAIEDESLQSIAKLSLTMSARIIAILAAEEFNSNFYKLWSKLREHAYTDENIPSYVDEEVKAMRERYKSIPVEKISTEEFLGHDDRILFMDYEGKLENYPKYVLSGDDRAYWWDGSDEVVFSEKMQKWLTQLADRHRQLVEEESDEPVNDMKFLEELLTVLQEANDKYKRIFAFAEMFYEFMMNKDKKEIRAAVKLLKALVEENEEYAKLTENMMNWDMANRKRTFNTGRLRIKRYLAVMANRKLREKYFGF